MQAGRFPHVAGTSSPRAAYRDAIELAVAAGEPGFGSFRVARPGRALVPAR